MRLEPILELRVPELAVVLTVVPCVLIRIHNVAFWTTATITTALLGRLGYRWSQPSLRSQTSLVVPTSFRGGTGEAPCFLPSHLTHNVGYRRWAEHPPNSRFSHRNIDLENWLNVNSWTCNVKVSKFSSHHCSTVLHPIPQINRLLQRLKHLAVNRHEHRNDFVYVLNVNGDSIGINACTVPSSKHHSFIDDGRSSNTDP